MEITFAGEYNKNELLQSLKIHNMRPRPESITRVIGAILIVLAYIFYLVTASDLNLNTFFGVTLPVIILVYIFARPFIAPYEAISKLTKNKDFKEKISGAASDEVIIWKTSLSSSELKWDVFHKAEIRENLLMLYQENNWYFLVTNSFFKNDIDWQNFKSLVKKKLQTSE
jgi:hypothetical protein